MFGQVQGDAAGGGGDPGGGVHEGAANGRGDGFAQGWAGEGAGGTGEVEGDAGQNEPGGVGGEDARGHVRQRGRFHVCVHVFDHRMLAVGFIRVDGALGAGGEERVEPEQVEQGALTGGDGFVQFRDAAHDQPPENLLAFLLRPERGEGDLGDFRDGDPLSGGFIQDGVGVFDRRPRGIRDRGDGHCHQGVHPGRDRYHRPGADRRLDDRTEVIGRVHSNQDHPRRRLAAEAFHGGQDIGDELARPAGGVRGTAPQPGGEDDRCGQPGADDTEQRVQPTDTGVAEPGAFFLVPVDFLDGVVDTGQSKLIDTGHDRGHGGEVEKPLGRGRVELADMAESERAQERAQRRGGVGSGEQFPQAAMAQHRHIVDGIRTREHPRHQRGHFQTSIRTEVAGQFHPLVDEGAETRFRRQHHHRDQTSRRHQIRVVEGCGHRPAG